jgi:hypothetical protein
LALPVIHAIRGGEEMLAREVGKRIGTWAAELVRLESDVERLGRRVRPARATASASEVSSIGGSGLVGGMWRIKRFPMCMRLLAAA